MNDLAEKFEAREILGICLITQFRKNYILNPIV
jgi:hypothetical protein